MEAATSGWEVLRGSGGFKEDHRGCPGGGCGCGFVAAAVVG